MIKILSTQFMQGVVDETAILYDGIPHIAFIGRSNVGKSSTLNALLDRRKLVKVGNTPGKTREINFFKVEVLKASSEDKSDDIHVCYFVDLPGYGYAKLSKTQRNDLQNLIRWYVSHPQTDTKVICIIIDAKVGMTDLDSQMIDLAIESGKQVFLAVNKIDKLNQKAQHKLRDDLKGNNIPYLLYSAVKRKHTNLLLNELIGRLL